VAREVLEGEGEGEGEEGERKAEKEGETRKMSNRKSPQMISEEESEGNKEKKRTNQGFMAEL
jgi:hypothetical protein